MKTPEQITDEILSLYTKFGNTDYIGEPVSQLEHMSQTAHLAIEEGFDDEVVLAAFFHDIGHICVMQNQVNNMGGYGIKSHEKIGSDYLRTNGFPDRVARLVESHVQAKRYLTFRFPQYYAQLSEASKKTLDYQGGIMSSAEANAFEGDPLFDISIRMRQWDELAKEMNIPILNTEEIRKRSICVLSRHRVTPD